MRARALSCAAFLLAMLLLSACRTGTRAPAISPEPEAGAPVAALAGQSRAYVLAAHLSAVPGPGAEARTGDVVMENGPAVFVVAGAGAGRFGPAAGNLIDAALQGGEDRMRLLIPLLGGGTPRHPVYTEVRVESAGGPDVPCAVVAEGALLGEPLVRVGTTYTLFPDSRALLVETRVENGTGEPLPLFGLRDVLCHGRTLRFVPDTGLFPAGRTSSSEWIAFFYEGRAWGVISDEANPMEGAHSAGDSLLRYGTVDILPGESRLYRRRIVVAPGGPEAIRRDARLGGGGAVSHLAVSVVERDGGGPVPRAALYLLPADGSGAVNLLADDAGRAEFRLPAGVYGLGLRAPGRAPVGPVRLECSPGAGYRLTLPMSERAEAALAVRERVNDVVSPTAGRVRIQPAPADGPAFAWEPWCRAALMHGAEEQRVPLPVSGGPLPTECRLVASRGPLYKVAQARVAAFPGQATRLRAVLDRVVDPGEYVAVDFRQHTEASADCALTVRERALLNACEGLQAAVVSDSVFRDLASLPLPGDLCALVPGRRVEVSGVGSFSFYPVTSADGWADDFAAAVSADDSAEGILATIRNLFPGSLVQVDKPLDAGCGVLALTGELPDAEFDALEILSGRDVNGARRLLARWFDLLNDGRWVIATGGSGSRGLAGAEAGVARTFVRCPGEGDVPRLDAVARAIRDLRRAPDAFVTNGPFIEAALNGQPIGSLQTVRAGKARLELRVLAAPWVDVSWVKVYCNGELIQEFPVLPGANPLRCDRAFEVAVTGDCWFVVQAEGDKPMDLVYGTGDPPTPWAVTNPFRVDADGDGLVWPRR